MDINNTIIDYKSQFDTLTTDFLNEYMKLHENMNSINSNLTKQLDNLQKENKSLIKLLETKETTIQSYESNKSTNDNNNDNKFDMIISQSKEISAKDKEIERLTKELIKLKNQNKQNLVSGWSPTSSNTPQPLKTVINDLSLNNPDPQPEQEKEPEPEKEFYEIIIRKKKYYKDNDNNIYDIVNDEIGSKVGTCIKNDKGKYKLIRS